MTRKDFELIAKTIREIGNENLDRADIANAFAWTLKETNPNFDSERFIKACLEVK